VGHEQIRISSILCNFGVKYVKIGVSQVTDNTIGTKLRILIIYYL